MEEKEIMENQEVNNNEEVISENMENNVVDQVETTVDESSTMVEGMELDSIQPKKKNTLFLIVGIVAIIAIIAIAATIIIKSSSLGMSEEEKAIVGTWTSSYMLSDESSYSSSGKLTINKNHKGSLVVQGTDYDKDFTWSYTREGDGAYIYTFVMDDGTLTAIYGNDESTSIYEYLAISLGNESYLMFEKDE